MQILLEKEIVADEEEIQKGILAKRIQRVLKSLRESARKSEPNPDQFSTPVFTETRKTPLNRKIVDRLVIFLRGSGCLWVEQGGGCTFCGFYNATNRGKKIADSDYFAQLNNTLGEYGDRIKSFPIMSLYNDGSMLSEKEISFSVLLKLIEQLSKINTLKRITLESRISDITEEKISALRKSTDKELELAFGFESANALIRKICVNKNFTNRRFLEICEMLNRHRIDPIALMMLKPPFLTENEAIEDAVKSIEFLNSAKIYRIDIELPTVEKFTLTHQLWEKGLYNPMMLWSVARILERCSELQFMTPIYISPPRYTVPSLAVSSNCALCDSVFFRAFEEYNLSGKIGLFHSEKLGGFCNCRRRWEKILIEQRGDENLLERVQNIMNRLEKEIEI